MGHFLTYNTSVLIGFVVVKMSFDVFNPPTFIKCKLTRIRSVVTD